MKLLELVDGLGEYTRIKRQNWNFFLVRPVVGHEALVKINLYNMRICHYMLTHDDLAADDWEIME
jgi:hypothetical protein